MYPQREPFVPTLHDLQKNARLLPSRRLHESWHDFLYWDSELEP